MSIILKEEATASAPVPSTSKATLFIDTADQHLKKKLSDGSVVDIEGAASGVTSFNARTGAVVPATSDYTAAQINNVPSGTILSTDVQGAINELDAEKIPLSQKGQALGVASLDSSAQIPISQLPPALVGALSYQGAWDASINAPALTSSVGTKGYYYVVSVAGPTNLDGISVWKVGDWAVFNGLIWQKIDNAQSVSSVNGYTGVVVLGKSDVGLGNVDNTSDLNKPISTATQNALNLKAAHVIPSTNQRVFVNSITGNDTTGDGSYDNPYATVQKCLTSITDASSTKPYTIALQATRQIETGDVFLKPYTFIVGDVQRATYFRINGGQLKPDASFATASGWCGLKNLYFGGTSQINFDLAALGGSNALFIGENLTLTGTNIFKGRNSGAGDFLEMYSCLSIGSNTFDSFSCQVQTTYFLNAVSFLNTQSRPSLTSALFGCAVNGNLTIDNINMNLENVSYLGTNTVTSVGTLTISSYFGLPPKPRRTLSGGTTLVSYQDATIIPYAPAVSGNWDTQPTDVKEGLDILAAGIQSVPITSKVLTNFAVDWNIITASDTILSAINKLAGRAALSINQISSDVLVPTEYTWLRQNRTFISGTTKITIQAGGKVSFIG